MARPPKVTDEEILEVARDCFVEGGPSVSTMTIAERLGVSQAALFKRFGTKHELLVRSCSPPALPGFLAQMRRGPDPERPIRPQIAELALSMLGFFETVMPRLMVLRSAGVNLVDLLSRFDTPPPVLGHRALSRWFATAARQGQLAPHDSDAVAFMFMGSLQARTMLPRVVPGKLPEIAAEVYVKQLVATLVDGLDPEEAP